MRWRNANRSTPTWVLTGALLCGVFAVPQNFAKGNIPCEKTAYGARATSPTHGQLASGKIPKGSRVTGRVAASSPAAAGTGSEISFRFDTLQTRQQTISITTNLRAIASFMEIEAAQIPVFSSGEGEVYDWLPTVQIGSDSVFGIGGSVTKWNDPNEVVGKSTRDGVLGHLSARPDRGCRGPLYGNEAPQALWFFSSDACGVYGLSNVAIAHAGRNDPVGLVVLKRSDGNVSLPSGTGMLLRIDDVGD